MSDKLGSFVTIATSKTSWRSWERQKQSWRASCHVQTMIIGMPVYSHIVSISFIRIERGLSSSVT